MADRIDAQTLTEFLDRWDEAAAAGDADAIAGMCAPDVVFDDTGIEAAIVGRDNVSELLGSLFADGPPRVYQRQDEFLSTDGNGGGARFGLVFATGRAIETVDLYEFDGEGLVSRWTTFIRDTDWTSNQLP